MKISNYETLCATARKSSFLSDERLFAPHPISKMEGQRLYHNLLFNVSTVLSNFGLK
jgi:hypothetical protein